MYIFLAIHAFANDDSINLVFMSSAGKIIMSAPSTAICNLSSCNCGANRLFPTKFESPACASKVYWSPRNIEFSRFAKK